MQKHIYGPIVWLIATLFVVYSFCLNTAAAVFSSTIQTTLHTSNMQTSFATGAFILGYACMQIPAGFLYDKFNARYVLSSGVCLLTLGNIAISFSNSLTSFAMSNFLQGMGGSFAFIGTAILISQWFPGKIFPILFGLTETISCTLAGVIHYFFSLQLQTHSWNSIYQALAVFGFILLILSLLLVKSPADYVRGSAISLGKSLKLVLADRQIWLCSIAGALSFGVLLAYGSLWYLKVQNFYNVDNLQSMIISGLIFVGVGIGTPILGYISNVFKSRVMIIHITLVIGTIGLLMGLYLPHYNIDTLIIIKVVSFFIGFFLSGSLLFYTIISERSSDSTRGLALSLLNTSVFLFNAFLLFIPYLFVTVISTQFFTYLWILPCCTLIAILLLYFIKDTYTTELGE